MKKWIALFSHTGSEIVNVSKVLGIVPDLVITNQQPSVNIHSDVRVLAKQITYVDSKPSADDYERLFRLDYDKDVIITLHGWMRIIPGKICKKYDIYNLHPGLITKYPELKGKDPQARVFNGDKSYEHVGCVLHRAIEEVDAGDVLMEMSTRNNFYSESTLAENLHAMAADMWTQFLEDRLK